MGGGGASCNPAPVRVFSKFTRLGLLVSYLRNLFSQTRSRARYRFENKFPKYSCAKARIISWIACLPRWRVNEHPPFFDTQSKNGVLEAGCPVGPPALAMTGRNTSKAKLCNKKVTNSSPLSVQCSQINETDFSRFTSHFSPFQNPAFTMAEVLITLGIIGIVAAMTLPSLIANHRRQVMLTKVKQTYTILNNALERAKVDYDTEVNNWYIPDESSTLEKSMFFAETYMIPYLEVLHYCKDKISAPYCNLNSKNLTDTGNIEPMYPVSSQYGTSFVLKNGTIVYVRVGAMTQTEIDLGGISRIWVIFDIDGSQGYNRYGYDVFRIELGGAEGPAKRNNANRNKFLPYGYDTNKNCDYYVSEINHACNKAVSYPGSYCLAYIVCNGWDFGDKYPW